MFKKLNLESIAQISNIKKEQGIEAYDILTVMILLSFISEIVHHFTKYFRSSLFQITQKILLLGNHHSIKFKSNICFITLSLVRYAIMDM